MIQKGHHVPLRISVHPGSGGFRQRCSTSGLALRAQLAMLRLSGGGRMQALEAPAYSLTAASTTHDGGPPVRTRWAGGTEPTHWHPELQSVFVVFVPLPPVSEMRLPRPWPPVFQGPRDDLHDGHREQDDRPEQHQLQHVRHRLGMDRVATSRKTSCSRSEGNNAVTVSRATTPVCGRREVWNPLVREDKYRSLDRGPRRTGGNAP